LQAISYKKHAALPPCRSQPAGDFLHEDRPVARRESLAGKRLQKQANLSPVGASLLAIFGVK